MCRLRITDCRCAREQAPHNLTGIVANPPSGRSRMHRTDPRSPPVRRRAGTAESCGSAVTSKAGVDGGNDHAQEHRRGDDDAHHPHHGAAVAFSTRAFVPVIVHVGPLYRCTRIYPTVFADGLQRDSRAIRGAMARRTRMLEPSSSPPAVGDDTANRAAPRHATALHPTKGAHDE